ncbi:hypothetical protein NKI16_32420 [Mesorhizobium sp. M0698]
MSVQYSQEHGQSVPSYVCKETANRPGGKVYQSVPGEVVDPAVSAVFVELMTPMTLEGQRRDAARAGGPRCRDRQLASTAYRKNALRRRACPANAI